MPFKVDTNQNRVPSKQVRYIFSMEIKGTTNNKRPRPRKTVICHPREVIRLCAAWEEEVLSRYNNEGRELLPLFERYLEEYVKRRKTFKQYKAEVRFYNNRMRHFFKDVKFVADVKRVHIEQYITWRLEHGDNGGPVSLSTVNKDTIMLSCFFTWCIKQDLYDRINPCYKAKLDEKNERYINTNIDDFFEIIDKARSHNGLFIAIMLAIYTGIREGEFLELRWSDIDFNTNKIHVRPEGAKYNKPRSVPLANVLRNYLLSQERISDKIVPISLSTVKRQFNRIRDGFSFNTRLSVKNLHIHDLRHIFAQTCANAGISMDDIGSFCGHASPSTTKKRYAQFGGYDGVRKINMMAEFLNSNRGKDGQELDNTLDKAWTEQHTATHNH